MNKTLHLEINTMIQNNILSPTYQAIKEAHYKGLNMDRVVRMESLLWAVENATITGWYRGEMYMVVAQPPRHSLSRILYREPK